MTIDFCAVGILALGMGATADACTISAHGLRVEHRERPLGLDNAAPRLSWLLESAVRGAQQSAYQVIVADAGSGATIWDSGKVPGDASHLAPYAGPPLAADAWYSWRVRVWDEHDRVSDWSEPAECYTGLWSDQDWDGAQWIALETAPEGSRQTPGIHHPSDREALRARGVGMNALPQFRKSVAVKPGVKRATLCVAGLGHHEVYLNGARIDDHFLDPGWTDYDSYALYVVHDITAQLQPGEAVFGVLLGNGFYSIPPERYTKLVASYGYPKLRFRLHVAYEDGTSEIVVSDPSWRVARSPITFTSIYGGEDYDATLETPGWMQRGFDDALWSTAAPVGGPPELRVQAIAPMKTMDTFVPVSTAQPRPGVWVYDMGQNASAIPCIRIEGRAGAVVRLTPGELLDDDGLVTQQASGGPHHYEYTLAGTGVETWQPRFSYYGFRYIQVEGATPPDAPIDAGLPVLHGIESRHVRNSARTVGEFRTSHDLYDRIYRLIDWAVRSNLASVVTDCPHREKLGWLEVPSLMGASMRYAYDLGPYLPKIIEDMKAAQLPNGMVPDIAPEYTQFTGGFRDSPEWGSAAVLLPWFHYQWYGDRRVLESAYEMMARYVAYLASTAQGCIVSHGLGDWYDLGPNPPGESQLTPMGVTGTAYLYFDLTILERTARLLGKEAEAEGFRGRADQVRAAFVREFLDVDRMQVATGSQAADALALYMGLVPDERRDGLFQGFVNRIAANDYQLTAGDVGFRYVIRALEEGGRSDVIHAMNNREDVPGYGYQLAHGATALTESWPALRFVSNNHCMLGHLMEWFYSGLGGIRQVEGVPAFRRIHFRPEPVGGIADAAAAYDSPYGRVVSAWRREGAQFDYDVVAPTGSSAWVDLPTTSAASVTESGRPAADTPGVTLVGVVDGRVRLDVLSGTYHFCCQMDADG